MGSPVDLIKSGTKGGLSSLNPKKIIEATKKGDIKTLLDPNDSIETSRDFLTPKKPEPGEVAPIKKKKKVAPNNGKLNTLASTPGRKSSKVDKSRRGGRSTKTTGLFGA